MRRARHTRSSTCGSSRSGPFAAAAATTFLLGATLFGAILMLPLYYQVDRGESALSAGLLMAPQGLGALCALPLSGRLTDRIGGGPIVLFGCLVATLATLPWLAVGATTPYPLLAAVLVVRGIGLGCAVQPAMASAYAVLGPEQVPRATAALNTLRQVGGRSGPRSSPWSSPARPSRRYPRAAAQPANCCSRCLRASAPRLQDPSRRRSAIPSPG